MIKKARTKPRKERYAMLDHLRGKTTWPTVGASGKYPEIGNSLEISQNEKLG